MLAASQKLASAQFLIVVSATKNISSLARMSWGVVGVVVVCVFLRLGL